MYPTAPPLHTFEKSLPFSLHLGFFLNLLSKLKYTAFFLDKQKKLHTKLYTTPCLMLYFLHTIPYAMFLTVLLLITIPIEASLHTYM